jgi:hypothetical protein
VLSSVVELDEPPTFGKRSFPFGCSLAIGRLAPFGHGIELAPLVPQLHAFAPSGAGWSTRLRRPLVTLDNHDFRLLNSELTPATQEVSQVVDDYTRWWREHSAA